MKIAYNIYVLSSINILLQHHITTSYTVILKLTGDNGFQTNVVEWEMQYLSLKWMRVEIQAAQNGITQLKYNYLKLKKSI